MTITGIAWLDITIILVVIYLVAVTLMILAVYVIPKALSDYVHDRRTPAHRKADALKAKQAKARARFVKKYGEFPK